MSGINHAAALTVMLDVCQDYKLEPNEKGHKLTVRFGKHEYKATKKYLYDFAPELGNFITGLPKDVKAKYLRTR